MTGESICQVLFFTYQCANTDSYSNTGTSMTGFSLLWWNRHWTHMVSRWISCLAVLALLTNDSFLSFCLYSSTQYWSRCDHIHKNFNGLEANCLWYCFDLGGPVNFLSSILERLRLVKSEKQWSVGLKAWSLFVREASWRCAIFWYNGCANGVGFIRVYVSPGVRVGQAKIAGGKARLAVSGEVERAGGGALQRKKC